ncbi:hypothetical protein JM84_0406 [Dokdonia sp. Hel_I_63]|jgi:hypothetical protein|uniref:hypothetical protein n=1 Tax=unclassified Dokdonia TaxID=2615033 RepID=UPI00020A74F4|nr:MULTISPECIES: hypothetical protein [unclassified Dokdonia]AEE19231.1 hypothetical protein Krodi_1248 [Dokdonia sp. 4H-3-7-5]AWH73677.1 hypothetical protein DCS32_05755 [Dokdonia sp. Dokd-P16]TVZ21532.1 hypothetical protein JM84_0406 [Dokdonia sp. Hel_I_63]
MDFPTILTTLAPALISLALYINTRYFPPSMGNSFLAKSPEWWMRDQATWNSAYSFLAQKYGIGTIALFAICSCLFFLESPYAAYGGYVALIAYVILANYQVRSYMTDKIK